MPELPMQGLSWPRRPAATNDVPAWVLTLCTAKKTDDLGTLQMPVLVVLPLSMVKCAHRDRGSDPRHIPAGLAALREGGIDLCDLLHEAVSKPVCIACQTVANCAVFSPRAPGDV